MSMSDDEKQKIALLREKLEAEKISVNWELHDDWTLLRHLRARALDLKQAYSFLVSNLEWREQHRVDTILEWFPKECHNFYNLRRYIPYSFHGKDRRGLPLYLNLVGAMDLVELTESMPIEHVTMYIVYMQELWMSKKSARTRETGENCLEGVAVCDLLGTSKKTHFSRAGIALFKEIVQIGEAHYPETLLRYFAVNCPSVVSLGWKLLRPFVDPNTQRKIFFFSQGSSPQDLQPMLDFVAADQLPRFLGGECECPGPGGCVLGGGAYSDLFAFDGTHWNPRTVQTAHDGCYRARLRVLAPMSTLRWSYGAPALKGATVAVSVAKLAEDGSEMVFIQPDPLLPRKGAGSSGDMEAEVRGESPIPMGEFVVVFEASKKQKMALRYHLQVESPFLQWKDTRDKEEVPKEGVVEIFVKTEEEEEGDAGGGQNGENDQNAEDGVGDQDEGKKKKKKKKKEKNDVNEQ